MKTIGVSAKVYVPVLLQLVGGIVLLLVGMTVEGKTLVVTAIGSFGAGYTAPPSPVLPDFDPDAGDVKP